MSARVKVWPGSMRTDGETFQPRPRSRAAFAPVPSVAIPPRPFSPVKFSGLIERVSALDRRYRSPTPVVRPLKGRAGRCWADVETHGRTPRARREHAAIAVREWLIAHT